MRGDVPNRGAAFAVSEQEPLSFDTNVPTGIDRAAPLTFEIESRHYEGHVTLKQGVTYADLVAPDGQTRRVRVTVDGDDVRIEGVG